mmetsp:Transcript_17829/g.26691  ORF Transcript_17829/g.26691 Transcript_17829/m.26691 type:complete len:198 (-) Transcript_17829:305-898(-)|eukprot:CAMPEP_0167757490 /NCGR_PEP_ID=MMETSP0110_2-20121227/9955_1 /TAXON_ID=629695 /ORGANISM="Gymnochlora sp., Strain CCMP2014" /LENGTH=197 /DNA_ID=CAMNT_0007643687 /DNA_START=106 /DNA_END=699 /DNA_ORIENTATION=+
MTSAIDSGFDSGVCERKESGNAIATTRWTKLKIELPGKSRKQVPVMSKRQADVKNRRNEVRADKHGLSSWFENTEQRFDSMTGSLVITGLVPRQINPKSLLLECSHSDQPMLKFSGRKKDGKGCEAFTREFKVSRHYAVEETSVTLIGRKLAMTFIPRTNKLGFGELSSGVECVDPRLSWLKNAGWNSFGSSMARAI